MENQKAPFVVKLDPGTHYLCKCKQSKNMPYCDGSHKGTDITPHKMEIVGEPATVAVCNCGKSDNPFFCDGSHTRK